MKSMKQGKLDGEYHSINGVSCSINKVGSRYQCDIQMEEAREFRTERGISNLVIDEQVNAEVDVGVSTVEIHSNKADLKVEVQGEEEAKQIKVFEQKGEE